MSWKNNTNTPKAKKALKKAKDEYYEANPVPVNTEWRKDKPTPAQITAIKNMGKGWNIDYKANPKTKGEACDEIQRLSKVIEKKQRTTSFSGVMAGMGAMDEWAYETGIGPFH